MIPDYRPKKHKEGNCILQEIKPGMVDFKLIGGKFDKPAYKDSKDFRNY